MKSTLSILLSAGLLGGCSTAVITDQQSNVKQQINRPSLSAVDTSVDFHNQMQTVLLNKQQMRTNEQLNQREQSKTIQDNSKNINYYVRGLMQDLVENLQYVNNATPVAVTSFVMLEGDYTQTNLLGNQISESLIHEVHKLGIPVLDFKTTNYIRVTEQGDFTFSKDFLDLPSRSPIRYVVAGTLLKYNDGYLVNARIIGIQSKAVVATAQSFIPDEVASAVLGNFKKTQPSVTTETVSPKTVASIVQG